MSDGLTASAAPPPTPAPHAPLPPPSGRPRRSPWLVVPAQALAVVAVFAAVGAAAGRLWYHLWDVPSGVVAQGQWFTSEAGLRDDFQGVAWYVAISVVAGLVLGVLSAWLLDRSELATLCAVVAGSALAAYVMYRVGTHLSPADPHELAKTAKDGTRLKGSLEVSSWPPRGAFTFGALVGLGVVYVASIGRAPTEVRERPRAAPTPGLAE